MAKTHACMTVKEIMVVHPGLSFYTTVTNLDKVDVSLPNHLKVGKVSNAPFEIAHVKEERYLCTPGTHANSGDSSENAVNYKPTLHLLEQMEKHDAIKEKDEEKLKKSFREDNQLPAKSKKQ